MHERKRSVAVVGDGVPEHAQVVRAERLGTLLVDAGYRVVTGGLGGVMEAACRGARRSSAWTPGDTIGILPGHDAAAASPLVDVAIPTGLGHGRNLLVAHADAVVALGGGAGTLAEIAFAWIHDRLVIAFRGPGWSGRLADTRLDARVRFPAVADDRVHGVDAPDEAIALLRAHFQERAGP